MTPQQAAHLRMLETLPKRTHQWAPTRVAWGIKRTPEQTAALTEKLVEAQAAGKTREQMKSEFCISQHTIEKLLGRKRK
jgi:hypothetical protein